MNPKLTVLLLSGGLDSVTLLHIKRASKEKIHCLVFNYHQRHAQEIEWAKYHARLCGYPITIMDLPQLGGLTEQSWIVPNRNAVFISVAVNFACQIGAQSVAIGCNRDDAAAFPDCRVEFIQAIQFAVKVAGYEVSIEAPFLRKSKAWIGGLAKEMGIAVSSIWTCYKGGAEPCGKCPACKKLQLALK